MLTTNMPRVSLAHLPTPLEPMTRLSTYLAGPELWIKRDDQTGLAGGGNKTRKLEYFVAAAQAEGADTLITGGAPQSNHCRQTAAAAARCGLPAILVLSGYAQDATGNILLDRLLNAHIIWTEDELRDTVMHSTLERERVAGRQPYLIPYGGSNVIGASSYCAAIEELAAQMKSLDLPPFDRIVFASSSGGTHAGLALGAKALKMPTQVLGISVDKPLVVLTDTIVAQLATATASLLGLDYSFASEDIVANADYLGGGYAIMGTAEEEAIRMFAQYEGILLDPVYTGRAAAGLIDLIQTNKIERGERILFWHTGGTPALFVPEYAKRLVMD